jgi:hypothetical protein
MTFDLENARGNAFSTGNRSWSFFLSMGRGSGWEPAGTLEPENYTGEYGEWDSEYLTNEGQTVTAEDAAALADALEQSLFEDLELRSRPTVGEDDSEVVDAFYGLKTLLDKYAQLDNYQTPKGEYSDLF